MTAKTIYQAFYRWVEHQPDAVAVTEDVRDVTYRQLDTMANAIMSKFYDKEYPFIGVVMSHCVAQIAAMLAVLKSGAS